MLSNLSNLELVPTCIACLQISFRVKTVPLSSKLGDGRKIPIKHINKILETTGSHF